MNKNFTCLLIGLLWLCGISSSAQVTFNISPESLTADVNDVVSVDVTVADFTGVMSAQFAIGWDENVLEYQGYTNLNSDLPGLADDKLSYPGKGNVAPNRFFVSWNHPSFINTDLPDNAILFTINFRALADGETTLAFVEDPPGIEIINANGQNLGFASDIQTTVTVGTGMGGDNGGGDNGGGDNGGGDNGGGTTDCTFTGFGLKFSDVDGAQGEEIVVDISVQDFQDIQSMQYTIDYDPSVLQFEEITNINLAGLSAVGNFGNPSPGKITVSWSDPQALGVTLDDATIIYGVRFTVLQEVATDVVLGGNPTSIEFIQEGAGGPLSYMTCGGAINEGSEGGGNNGGGNNTNCEFTGFGIKFGNISGTAGTEVCMDVTVQDFNEILSLQYTMNYDPDILQFESITNTNLTGLTAGGNFGNPSPGKVTVFWFDQAVTGITLPDDTRIYSICFTILEDTPTSLTLGDDPTAIEFSAQGTSGAIDYSICGGAVNGGGNTGGNNCTVSGFGIDMGNVTAEQGTETCIDFAVQDFDLITSLQFTIEYDPAVLEYQAVSNIDLPDMSAGGNFGNPEPGKITVFWFHQATTGVTKDDGTVIFSVCFNVLQTTGTNITLGDSPTAIEFSKFGEAGAIAYDICPGSVNMVTGTPPVISNAAVTPTSCSNTTDGAVALTVGGGSTYTYQWSRGTANGNTVTGLASGPISVTVTDTNSGLTTTDTYTVTSPTAVTVNANIVQVSCKGANNGSVVITASGGTGNLNYAWMPGGGSGSTLNNLAPGSYGLTISDANGCSTNFGPYVITEPSDGISVTETIVDVECASDNDGSITVNVSGGTPNYRLDWSGNLLDNIFTQTGLKAGNYGLTVTDARNCSETFQFTVGSEHPAIQISAVPVNIPEGGSGAVNITASAGSGSFSYKWTGPNGFGTTSEDLTGLTTPGEYCVTVTDAAGCTETNCVTIGRELIINDFTISQPCAGGSNGGIDISVQGGVAPFTFNWTKVGSGGTFSTEEDLSGISAGTYNLTVTDVNKESINGSFEVSATDVQIEANITTTAPGATTGAIELVIPNEAGGYTLAWDNGATTETISNLAIGEYCVTITFDGGCSFEECYQVTDEPFSIVSLQGTDAGCAGDTDGTVSLQVKGGVKPYTLKMGGSDYTSNNGTFLVEGLAPGPYDLVVSDAGGSNQSRQITIGESSTLTYDAVIVHDTEDSGCTGSITLQISGGTGPYTVSWNGQGLVGQQIIVCGFDYTAIITDSKGCSLTTDPISVTTFSESAEITNVSCPGEEDAVIDLSVTGGNANTPYTFAWRDTPGGPVISTEEDLSGVGEGTYYVEVSEASGNKLSRSYSVGTVSGLKIQASVESDYNGFGVSCVDATDGVLEAIVTNPEGMVEYEWLLDGAVMGTSAVLNNAAGGEYVLRVIDDNCLSEIPVTLPAPDPLVVEELNVKNVACDGERDGAIVVGATGGTAPYIYRWSNNDFGNEIDFLAAGPYTVTVTDRNNCSADRTFDVGEPTPLEVTIMTEPATNELGSDCNGSVRAMVTGGQEPYNYKWININNRTENMVTNLCPGEYIVEVSDALGCLPVQVSGIVRDRTQPCFSARTVITPDGDGLNESFIIFCSDEYPSNELKIYNRWGELVYQADNYDCTESDGECFRGRRKDSEEILPEGAYFWVLEYTDNATGDDVQLKGSLTILAE